MLKPLLIAILALAIVAAAVFVGGKYWGEKAADETAGWETYRNEEYGFSLTFPESWESYTVEISKQSWNLRDVGIIDAIVFGLPAQKDLFVIFPIPLEKIERFGLNKFNPINWWGPVDYLNENSQYVFYYQTAQDVVDSSLVVKMNEFNSIKGSFQPLK